VLRKVDDFMKKKSYKTGYTAGVYDMFHIGHLNVIRNAKKQCKYLIVGVTTDEIVLKNKGKLPVIPFDERIEIVRSIRYVDKVIPQTDYSIDGKIKTAVENKIDVMFVGSDWQNTDKWKTIEKELKRIGVDVIYLPHTDGISSTILRKKIKGDLQ